MNRPYDRELPVLAELEHAWRQAAHAVLPAASPALPAPAAPASRRRERRWRATAGRTARRAAVLTGLGCLVAASAVATRSLVETPDRDPTLRTSATARLAAGTLDGEPWFLDAYRRDRQLCHDLLAGGRVATACAEPPRPRQLQVDGIATAQTRILAGYAGADVARVRVAVAGRWRTATTRPLTGKRAAGARLPRQTRWFLTSLPRGQGADGPVRVVAYDRSGRAIGRPRTLP